MKWPRSFGQFFLAVVRWFFQVRFWVVFGCGGHGTSKAPVANVYKGLLAASGGWLRPAEGSSFVDKIPAASQRTVAVETGRTCSYGMNSSRMMPERGASNMPQAAPSTTPGQTLAPGSSKPAAVPTAPPAKAEVVQLADKLAQQLYECQAYSTGWLIKAGQILGHYMRLSNHGQMTAIHNAGRLPWGQRYCQVLASLARNPALSDPRMLQNLPASVAALEIIASHLDAAMIREGVRHGLLHPRLTRRTALDVCRRMRTQALLKNPTVALP